MIYKVPFFKFIKKLMPEKQRTENFFVPLRPILENSHFKKQATYSFFSL